MKHFNKFLLRASYILALIALLCLAGQAADSQTELRVLPSADEDYYFDTTQEPRTGRLAPPDFPSFVTGEQTIEVIKRFEGFSPEPIWDYQRYSIGYGSSYEKAKEMFPDTVGVTGVITEEEATILLKDDLKANEGYLNSFLGYNSIVVNQNQFDALADFTYGVGIGWTTYKNSDGTWCLLKEMLLDDPSTWTESRVREAFGTWVYAGGVMLEGLRTRRRVEADMFLKPMAAAPGGFLDVSPDAWYSDSVARAKELGLMNGYSAETFAPNDHMSRAAAAQALANFNRADLTLFQSRPSIFLDVGGDAWYCGAVNWAYGAGLINGRGDGTFGPDAAISRQHLCSILARYLRSRGIQAPYSAVVYADDSLIEGTSRADVYFCTALGLVNGVGEGRFDPAAPATRAQVATILVRMYELVNNA